MAMASILIDEGYSQSFDRCFKAVNCCEGNIDDARDILSKITITEIVTILNSFDLGKYRKGFSLVRSIANQVGIGRI